MYIHFIDTWIFKVIHLKLDNSSRYLIFLGVIKMSHKKIIHYLVGVWIFNIRFSTTCNISHQDFFNFGHQNNFRMWITYRKYSLCTKKKIMMHLRNLTEDIYKISFKKITFKKFLFGNLPILYNVLFRTSNGRIFCTITNKQKCNLLWKF